MQWGICTAVWFLPPALTASPLPCGAWPHPRASAVDRLDGIGEEVMAALREMGISKHTEIQCVDVAACWLAPALCWARTLAPGRRSPICYLFTERMQFIIFPEGDGDVGMVKNDKDRNTGVSNAFSLEDENEEDKKE